MFLRIRIWSVWWKVDEKKSGERLLQGFSDELSSVKRRIVPYQTNLFVRICFQDELQNLDDFPLVLPGNRKQVGLACFEIQKPHEVLGF